MMLGSQTEGQFKKWRLETGIAKPTIFLGLMPDRTLGIPNIFPLDIMHLVSLNISELLILLWRGNKDLCDRSDNIDSWDWAVLKDDRTWKQHGQEVADTRVHLPGSFDRYPRNPAEKINSGYKAYEFLNYIFGLGPGLLVGTLPEPYYSNYCKLVQGVRIIQQHQISIGQLKRAHRLLLEFVRDFETIYYRRKPVRLHFIRQSIHALLHLGTETCRVGPLAICSQWPMERTIGNLGEEVKQHSNPFSNLSQRGVRRCRVNAIMAMIPDLGPEEAAVPTTAIELGDGFCLLRARDRSPYLPSQPEMVAIRQHLELSDETSRSWIQSFPSSYVVKFHRWARLAIPTGQIARSSFKERTMKTVRMSRNVKVQIADEFIIGEVQYYFRLLLNQVTKEYRTYVMISKFSEPNPELLARSSGALYSCKYLGKRGLMVFAAKSIVSVVAMVESPRSVESRGEPLPAENADHNGNGEITLSEGKNYFLVEKVGLDIIGSTEVDDNLSDFEG